MHLEVEIIPVCDVDGAKEFYNGWVSDSTTTSPPLEGLRIVQLTPQRSGTAAAAVRRAGQRSHE
jgi:hypothetical protein